MIGYFFQSSASSASNGSEDSIEAINGSDESEDEDDIEDGSESEDSSEDEEGSDDDEELGPPFFDDELVSLLNNNGILIVKCISLFFPFSAFPYGSSRSRSSLSWTDQASPSCSRWGTGTRGITSGRRTTHRASSQRSTR